MESHRLIAVTGSDTGNGSLAMFQHGGGLGIIPFDIKKVLVVSGMKPRDVRGRHAHRETQEVIIPIQGGCDIEIDDGTAKTTVTLSGMSKGLYLPPRVWRTLKNFQEGTILLLIADREYDEQEYIRSYEEFRRVIGSR